MKTLAPAVLLAAALTLTACSAEAPAPAADSTPAATAAPEVTVEPAPTEAAETPAPRLPALPDVAPATGAAATNGVISVVVPDAFAPDEPYEGVQFWIGGAIPESTSPDGSESLLAGVQLYPAEPGGWDGTVAPREIPRGTQTVYALDVPGADAAAVEVVSVDTGETLDGGEGMTMWNGPHTNATVQVLVGDQLSRIQVSTSPGQAGLELVAAIARGITVA